MVNNDAMVDAAAKIKMNVMISFLILALLHKRLNPIAQNHYKMTLKL
jgi:hypothetical protein